MRKIILIAGALLAVLALIAGGAYAGYMYRTEYRETALCAFASPDGAYVLEVRSVGEPDFPFGSARIRMRLKNGEKELCRIDASAANDGGWAQDSNFEVQWSEAHALVTIHSEEAPDVVYQMGFDGAVVQKSE